MSDSQCEETLTDFFNQWTSVQQKIDSRRKTSSKNYLDLVDNISGSLKEIQKSIALLTTWKKDVAEIFEVLQPSVTHLIKSLETPNKDGQHVGVTQSIEGEGQLQTPNNEGLAICHLEHIKENVHEIKNGTEHIVKLPRVEPKEKSKKKRTINWKTTMLEETIMGSPAMAMARSTYDGLEHHLKLCFLSLSIFPENSIIRKRSLIYWWIGEGFVDAEKKAEECFDKLCKSGLVEAVEEQYSRSPRSCRLYPLIRRMAIEIAEETMFFDFGSDGKPLSGPSHCTRRAFVAGTSGGEEVAELRSEKVSLKPEPSKLESLFNVDVSCIELDEEDFRKLNKVKTLQLGKWMTAPEHHIELSDGSDPIFLTHLKQLKKLRYLGLQGISRITELADIQHLGELRVLDLRACHNLEKLPEEIAKLKKLTHLDVSECYLLEYMPKGLGDLSELQLLNGFVVNTWSKKACQVSELTKLGNLEKLSISLGMKAMVDGVLDPIGEINGLKSLRITWGSTSTEEEHDDRTRKMKTANDPATQSHNRSISRGRSKKRWFKDGKTIKNPLNEEGLCLPPKLTKLDLQCYPKKEPPHIKRKLTAEKSLEKLYFRGGGLKSLSGIKRDEVSKVEFIRLRFLEDFDMKKEDFKVEFPSLQLMQAYECPHIPYTIEVVSPGEIASPQRKDEASTSTNRST